MRTIARSGLIAMMAVWTLTNTLGATHSGSNRDREEEKFGPWTVAVNLGPVVNSAFADAGPAISRNGLSLYVQSQRHSPGVDSDLYVSRRAAIDLPWEAPVSLGPIVNSSAPENAPHFTRDERRLLFASSRSGNFDIYVSSRRDVNDDLAWEPPIPLPAPINGPSLEVGPSYVQNLGGHPQLYFASDRGNGLGLAGADIYMSELQRNGTWTAPTPVAEVNSVFQDSWPAVRADGLEMILASARDGNVDLYASHRNRTWEPWSVPERIGMPVNTAATDTQAALPRMRRHCAVSCCGSPSC